LVYLGYWGEFDCHANFQHFFEADFHDILMVVKSQSADGWFIQLFT
jgi:hypothetical protein